MGYVTSQGCRTVLMAAVDGGRADTVELLLDCGADLNSRDMVSQPKWPGWQRMLCMDYCPFFWHGRRDITRSRVFCSLCTSRATAGRLIVVALWGHVSDVLQSGNDAFNFCINDSCARVLRSAERIQRWHRRRLLVMWER